MGVGAILGFLCAGIETVSAESASSKQTKLFENKRQNFVNICRALGRKRFREFSPNMAQLRLDPFRRRWVLSFPLPM